MRSLNKFFHWPPAVGVVTAVVTSLVLMRQGVSPSSVAVVCGIGGVASLGVLPALHRVAHAAARRRDWVTWATMFIHLAAGCSLVLVRPGTEANRDLVTRSAWIDAHGALWTVNWLLWMCASASLLAFCFAWRDALRGRGTDHLAPAIGCGIVAIGLVFDLMGETLMIVAVGRGGISMPEFAASFRAYQVLSPVIANGLYCVGGLTLSVTSWQIRLFPRTVECLGIWVWTIGSGLTIAALFNHLVAMAATGIGVIVSFSLWTALVAIHFRALIRSLTNGNQR